MPTDWCFQIGRPKLDDHQRRVAEVPLHIELGRIAVSAGADETAIVAAVREWVDREVKPMARELEHADSYPEALIEQMKLMGIFGLAIPEPWHR